MAAKKSQSTRTAAKSEEELFQQFRPTGVSAWGAAISQASRPYWVLLGIGLAVVVGSWAALTYLPATTGQQYSSIEDWKNRIETASEQELLPVFLSLYQVQNDKVIELGVNYMLASDSQKRLASGVALRDSVKSWKEWDFDASTQQVNRVALSLANHVSMLNSPEQAVAIEVARQLLLWPTGSDADSHTQLLLSCENIFKQANRAFDDGVRSPTLEDYLLATTAYNRLNSPETSDPEGVLSLDRLGGGDLIGQLPSQSQNRTNNSSFSSSPNVRMFNSGYRRRSRDLNQMPENELNDDGPLETAMVPLLDEAGSRMNVSSVDPSTMQLPGGLIPITVSGSGGVRSNLAGSRGIGNRASEQDRNLQPNQSQNAGRSLPPRDSLLQALEKRNIQDTQMMPGPDSYGQELRGRDLRGNNLSPERGLAGNRSGVGSDTGDGNNPGNEQPMKSGQSPVVQDRSAFQGSSGSLGRNENQSGLSAGPSLESGPAASSAGTLDEPRRLPENPYRSRSSAGSMQETMQRLPSQTLGGNRNDLQARMPLSDSSAWEMPSSPMSQWSHIQLMQQLRNSDTTVANRSEEELRRRGFTSEYLSIAYRLTSDDPVQRFDLVQELVQSSKVEPLPFLKWLSDDQHPEVRAAALEQLRLLTDPQAVRFVQQRDRNANR